jgi:tRNA-2-methylthio-N6-dimethylallyladenosine synthase
MNVADSELVEGLLQKEGYQPTTNINNADAIFVNTCAIREHAEEKVHSQLGRYNLIKKLKPATIIGVLGCMAQNHGEELLKELPHVDFIIGTGQLHKVPDIIEELSNERIKHVLDILMAKPGFPESIQALSSLGYEAVIILLVGGGVLALPFAIVSYCLSLRFFTKIQEKRREKHIL